MSIVVFVNSSSTVVINNFIIFCLTNQDAEQIYIQKVLLINHAIIHWKLCNTNVINSTI